MAALILQISISQNVNCDIMVGIPKCCHILYMYSWVYMCTHAAKTSRQSQLVLSMLIMTVIYVGSLIVLHAGSKNVHTPSHPLVQ